MNKELIEELMQTSKLLSKNYTSNNIFEKYSSIYTFTTENIKGFYKNLTLKNKEILIICSSGDHIFNALLQEPKKIVAYDINCLTKHIFELKKAAIIELEYNEFIDYFFVSKYIKSKKTFNRNTYDKIKKSLTENSRIYWDYIYKNYTDTQIRTSKLFKNSSFSKNTIKYINPYLKEEQYLILKEKLKNFNLNFINSDIRDLKDKINDKFDYIYLSNIAFYFKNKTSLIELKEIVLKLKKLLKENGRLDIIYLYNYKDDYFLNTTDSLYNPEKRAEYFPDIEYNYHEFPSIVIQKDNTTLNNTRIEDRDAILTLTKNK